MAAEDDLDDILDSALDEFEEDEKEREKETKQSQTTQQQTPAQPGGGLEDDPDKILEEELAKQFQNFPGDFEESLKQLSEQIEAKMGKDGQPPMGMPSEEEMKKLFSGLEGGLEGESFDEFLSTMAKELVSKDVLAEPMTELAKNYREWLASNRDKKSSEEIEKVEKQLGCIDQICHVLAQPENESTGNTVEGLLEKMEEYGPPPEDIYKQCFPPGGGNMEMNQMFRDLLEKVDS